MPISIESYTKALKHDFSSHDAQLGAPYPKVIARVNQIADYQSLIKLANAVAKHSLTFSGVSKNPQTEFVRHIADNADIGICHNVKSTDCCKKAELYLLESIRHAQKLPFLHHKSEYELAPVPVPVIIFTKSGKPVAVRKNVGLKLTYAFKDEPAAKLKSHTFAVERNIPNLALQDYTDEPAVKLELSDALSFKTRRFAVTAFDADMRALIPEKSVALHAALNLTNQSVVDTVMKMATHAPQIVL